MTQFYTYVHAKPFANTVADIFYVGKGTGKRAYSTRKRNFHHSNLLKKYGLTVGKFECSSEEIAFALEKGLIKCLRNSEVALANCTDGGEGVTGYKFTDAQRQNLKEAMNNTEVRSRIGAAAKIRNLGRRHSDHARHNYKAAQNNPELKERLSALRSKLIWIKKDNETRRVGLNVLQEYLEAGWKQGRLPRTPEQNAKTSATMKGSR